MLIDSAVVIESCIFGGTLHFIMHDGPDVNLIVLDFDDTVAIATVLDDECDTVWSDIIDNADTYRVDYLG